MPGLTQQEISEIIRELQEISATMTFYNDGTALSRSASHDDVGGFWFVVDNKLTLISAGETEVNEFYVDADILTLFSGQNNVDSFIFKRVD